MLTFKGSQLMERNHPSTQAHNCYQTYSRLWLGVPHYFCMQFLQLAPMWVGKLTPRIFRCCSSVHAQDSVLEERADRTPCSTKIIPDIPPTTHALPWSVIYWGWYFLVSFSQCRQGDIRPDPLNPAAWTDVMCFFPSQELRYGGPDLTHAIECHILSHISPPNGTKWLQSHPEQGLIEALTSDNSVMGERAKGCSATQAWRAGVPPPPRPAGVWALDSIRPVPEGSTALQLRSML